MNPVFTFFRHSKESCLGHWSCASFHLLFQGNVTFFIIELPPLASEYDYLMMSAFTRSLIYVVNLMLHSVPVLLNVWLKQHICPGTGPWFYL